MKNLKTTIVLILILVYACKQEDTINTTATPSDEANLLKLELAYAEVCYPTAINGKNIALVTRLPFDASSVSIKDIEISPNARVNRATGDEFFVSESPYSIEVTAEDNLSKQTYLLALETTGTPDYSSLLFEQYTANDCATYSTITVGDLKVENNLWNAGALPANGFSQCIYTYENAGLQLLGWQWQFPDDAYGVNAYPQLIYGWKPWQPPSTTALLPQKISDIAKLKVTYDIAVTRNNGDYNLAFDNWINSSPNITPQNIQFELMIWEDAHNLVPFGDFQEDVNTTNGLYKFYMGEPTWEPPGSDWIYLAFQRIDNRSKGTVDIDELLFYLITKGIVSPDSYLASIELGNEVGNSTGQAIIKAFSVEIE